MAEGKIHNFKGSLEVEKRVRAVLANVWQGMPFKDVTGDKRFHSIDVDYLYAKGSRPPLPSNLPAPPATDVYLELKADGTEYHNFFFELISNAKYGVDTPGCFIFSRAYAWAYVFEETQEMFVFDQEKMRYWILGRFDRLKGYLKATTNQKDDGSFALTIGLAIPVKKILEEASPEVPMTYLRLPGFGVIPHGAQSVPRPRLPEKFQHLDNGLQGMLAMLESAPKASSQTKAIAYQADTSPLRRHVLGIKEIALEQTRGLKEFVKQATLGPHYEPLLETA